MMVVPRGKLFLLTALVSKASWFSGRTENRGTLRNSSIDTLAGAVISPSSQETSWRHILSPDRRGPSQRESARNLANIPGYNRRRESD